MAEKKVICDTDVMIDYFDESNSRHIRTASILEKEIKLDNIVLTAVTKMELLLGATNKNDLSKIVKEINRFNIALINDEISIKALELVQKYSLSHGLRLPDSLIAATSLVSGLELFTHNRKDYIFIDRIVLYKNQLQ